LISDYPVYQVVINLSTCDPFVSPDIESFSPLSGSS
jgi:hypothetical protein